MATTGAYKHAFALANTNQRPTLSIAMHDPAAPYKFAMGALKKLKLKFEQDKYIDVSMDWIAQKGVADGALTPVHNAENYLLGKHATITLADTLAGLGA